MPLQLITKLAAQQELNERVDDQLLVYDVRHISPTSGCQGLRGWHADTAALGNFVVWLAGCAASSSKIQTIITYTLEHCVCHCPQICEPLPLFSPPRHCPWRQR